MAGHAAKIPFGAEPTRDMKFAYYAAVGNADFNYGEFVHLRPKLDAAGARYHIRIFDGQHGWAPPEVWAEALNWMDLQAMASGTMPRDPARIQQTLASGLARARDFQSQNNRLAALREYQSLVCDFRNLADVSSAEASLAGLSKDKAVKSAEKEEMSALAQQAEIIAKPSSEMQAIAVSNLDNLTFMDLKSDIADLKKRAADSRNANDLRALVPRRTLGGLVVEAYESGEHSLAEKNYHIALLYFDLAAAGSSNPAWAHYQRARAYAMLADRKNTLSELKISLAEGFHEPSALEAPEFQSLHGQPQFQSLSAEWTLASEKDESRP